MGGIAAVGTYPKTNSIDTKVGITVKEGIGASSSVYSGGVYKWASPY